MSTIILAAYSVCFCFLLLWLTKMHEYEYKIQGHVVVPGYRYPGKLMHTETETGS
jgi:hypothetical protein